MAAARISEVFEKLYRALNAEQRRAVDAIDGPVMVVAGPGTGKTHLLTMRIANILRLTDTPPESILALTFTESAAHEMRERLLGIIGTGAYRAHIATFHGFCNDVIRRFPGEFARIIGSTPASEADQLRILEEIIGDETLALEHLRPFGNPYYYVRAALGAIHEFKRDGISPEAAHAELEAWRRAASSAPDRLYEHGRFKGTLRASYRALEKQCAKQNELIALYERYENALRAEQRYDYEDMVTEVVSALERSEDLLLDLAERYLYILADEHQDANRSQDRLLALLASPSERPNLFVVGDDKQAIFRFQGASAENFRAFSTRYQEAVVIDLRENYRSRQSILDAAHSAITHTPQTEGAAREHTALRAARGPGEPVSVVALANPVQETLYVAREIERLIAAGTPAGDIAVIYRTNRDADALADVLERRGIPLVVRSDQNALADPLLRQLIVLLRAIEAPQEDELLSRALFLEFLGIDHLAVYELLARYEAMRRASRAARAEGERRPGAARPRERLIHLLFCARDGESGAEGDAAAGTSHGAESRTLRQLSALLRSWASFARGRGLLETLELVVRESGFLAALLKSPDGYERIRALENLFRELERAVPGHRAYGLSEALRHLDILERYGVSVRGSGEARADGVVLLTAHKAKGLEFQHVFIVRAVDGHWGGRRLVEHFPRFDSGTGARELGASAARDQREEHETDDERRLFYVALTRARERVTITHARAGDDGRALLPSRFIEEIHHAHRKTEDTSGIEPELERERERLFGAPPAATRERLHTDRSFLRERFLAQGLSVTALNNYLACPWRYFFENLVRMPKAPNRHQLYGVAVHSALRELFETLARGETASEERFLKSFERALGKTPLSEQDFAASREKGTRALSGYFRTYSASFAPPLRTEMRIGGVALEGAHPHLWTSDVQRLDEEHIPPVPLTGVLDKVELIESQSSRVRVVDYKTGRPRSRNDIEGKTQSSRGDYFRQLVFYKLLLDRFENGRLVMGEGEIDFVESDSRGRYHRERFEVTSADVAALEADMRRVVGEIWALSFWERRCEERECEYCALRQLMGGYGEQSIVKNVP